VSTPLRPPLAPVKAKVLRRRRKPEDLPEKIKQRVNEFGNRLRTEFPSIFVSNPQLKHRVGQFLASQLPPYPRRPGRPGFPDVTRADKMLTELHRQHPDVPYPALWKPIYPVAIVGYGKLSKLEKRAAKNDIRQRVRWRRRDRKRRALRRARIAQS